MGEVTLYVYEMCSKSKEVIRILMDADVSFEIVNFNDEVFTAETILDLARKLDTPVLELLRKKEPVYKELELDKGDIPDEALAEIMIKAPELIGRPILEAGEKVMIVRPPELAREFLDTLHG